MRLTTTAKLYWSHNLIGYRASTEDRMINSMIDLFPVLLYLSIYFVPMLGAFTLVKKQRGGGAKHKNPGMRLSRYKQGSGYVNLWERAGFRPGQHVAFSTDGAEVIVLRVTEEVAEAAGIPLDKLGFKTSATGSTPEGEEDSVTVKSSCGSLAEDIGLDPGESVSIENMRLETREIDGIGEVEVLVGDIPEQYLQ